MVVGSVIGDRAADVRWCGGRGDDAVGRRGDHKGRACYSTYSNVLWNFRTDNVTNPTANNPRITA